MRFKNAARVCPLLESQAEGAEWVECCTQRFYPVAVRIAGDNDLALDALQESWIKVIQAVHAQAYRGDPPACAWVRTIVANTANGFLREHIRRRGRNMQIQEAVSSTSETGRSPEDQVRDAQMYQLLAEMIAALPETYRTVLELRYGRELSTGETAEQLHISRSSVSTRLNRAVALLRKRIKARLASLNSRLAK